MSKNLLIIEKAEDFNSSAFLFCNNCDQQFFPTPWSLQHWRDLFSQADHSLLMLVKDEHFIGFCLFQLSLSENFAHLQKIIIKPEVRGQGFAFALLNSALDHLKARGTKTYFLEVEVTNNGAIALYERCGFKKIHEKKNFYSNGQSALIMTHEN